MYKDILKNILPSMIATLFTGLYVVVDGFFIGNKMGELGLAAINIAWPITAIIIAFGVSLGTSSGIFISYYRAKGEEEKIKKCLTNTLILGIFFVLFSFTFLFYIEPLLRLIGATDETMNYAKSYIQVIIYGSFFELFGAMLIPIMRNFSHVKSAALILIITTGFNFLGDYLFIYKFELELYGAAIASVLGQALAFILCLIVLIYNKNLKLSKELDFKYMLKLILKAIAPFILNYSASFIIIIYNLFALKNGGNDAVAAYTVFAYIVYIPQYIAIGVSDGVQPLLTYHYGLKDNKIKAYFYNTLWILFLLLGILSIIFTFLKNPVAAIFNLNDPKAKEIYDAGYVYFISSFVFIGIIRIFAARYYSTDLSNKANLVVIIEPIITPLVLLLLTYFIGVLGVWVGFLIIQITLSLLSILFLKMPIKEFSIGKLE